MQPRRVLAQRLVSKVGSAAGLAILQLVNDTAVLAYAQDTSNASCRKKWYCEGPCTPMTALLASEIDYIAAPLLVLGNLLAAPNLFPIRLAAQACSPHPVDLTVVSQITGCVPQHLKFSRSSKCEDKRFLAENPMFEDRGDEVSTNMVRIKRWCFEGEGSHKHVARDRISL